jgi:hypothetical protein
MRPPLEAEFDNNPSSFPLAIRFDLGSRDYSFPQGVMRFVNYSLVNCYLFETIVV